MLGPLSRASSLPSFGTSLSSTSGAGNPMLPGRGKSQLQAMAKGEGGGRGLGGADAGDEDDALAAGRDAHLLQLVPDVLLQARAGVEQHLEAAEEVVAQRLVGAQMRQQRLEALRHVEVDRRGDLFEVARGRGNRAGQRLAL